MRRLWLYPLPVMVAALICAAPGANADALTLTLTSSVQSALAGQVVPFSATLTAPCTNTGADFLAGDSGNVSGPLLIDDSPFLFDWPLSLNSCGNVDNQVLFNVDVPSSAVHRGLLSPMADGEPAQGGEADSAADRDLFRGVVLQAAR